MKKWFGDFALVLVAAIVVLGICLGHQTSRNGQLTTDLVSADQKLVEMTTQYNEQVQIAGEASMQYAVLREFVETQVFTTVRANDAMLGLGRLEFPSYEPDQLVVWPGGEDGEGGASYCGGAITPATQIDVVGASGVNRQNLSLLSGRRVFAYGSYSYVGEGECAEAHIKKMTIVVLPKDGER